MTNRWNILVEDSLGGFGVCILLDGVEDDQNQNNRWWVWVESNEWS